MSWSSNALRTTGLWAALWTGIGFVVAGQNYLSAAQRGHGLPWSLALTDSLANWCLFGLLAWPAAHLARKFHLGGANWKMRLTLHAVAGAVYSLLWILFRALLEGGISPLRGSARPFGEVLRYALVATFVFNMLVYWVIVTGVHAMAYYRSFREREMRVLELERRVTAARLHALQMQLNPHFLFNALNGISSLMYRDVEAADTMLVKLSELLRLALDRGGHQLVPLRDELAFLDRYLDLEQMRFGERLKVERQIEPGTLSVPVPNLILQPVVENAIKHGLEPNSCDGVIRLSSRLEGGRLILTVEDNGRGLGAGNAGGTGVGTANCRQRLQQLYGKKASFELESRLGGGVVAKVILPVVESVENFSN